MGPDPDAHRLADAPAEHHTDFLVGSALSPRSKRLSGTPRGMSSRRLSSSSGCCRMCFHARMRRSARR